MENYIQLTFNQILSGAFLIAIVLGFIQWLLFLWVKVRLEKSIQHEYDKKIEDYKFIQLQKQKAGIIARLFSKWIKYRGEETKILSKLERFDYYEDLNRMSIEISLWIKDDDLLNNIMKRLNNSKDAKNIRSIIGDMRRLILNFKKDDFDSNNVIIWPTDDILKELLK